MTTIDPPAINDDWVAWRARVDERLRSIERHGATKEDLAKLKEALTWRIILAMGGFATIVTVLDRLLP